VSDPVCGMLVNPAQAAASGNTLAYRGASHYFSSRQGKQMSASRIPRPVRMISRTVEIKLVLLHVFTVISLITRQAELPFLVDLVDCSPLFGARRLHHSEAPTVALQVKVIVVEPAVGELAGRPELGAKMCADGERHFFDLGLQLTTTVIGVGAACSGAVLIRKRWPSADTSYE
jgi:YHS domain-containing protein